jgi:type VI secretion system secreted protein Hcp
VFESFLQVEGIPGESTDAQHKDWIDLTGWDHAMEALIVRDGSGAIGTVQRANHKGFLVSKLLDRSSVKLYEAVAQGRHIRTVKLEAVYSDGPRSRFLEVVMKDVLVTRSQIHAGPDTPSRPTESFAFVYGEITWTYAVPPRPDGTEMGLVTARLQNGVP